jgi:monoamine oxidase
MGLISMIEACRTLYYKNLPKTNSPKKVLVIGAGMAGISAGHFLKLAGHEVEILEARDRIGGRIWTNRESYPIDLGAAWIHGSNNNPLTELKNEFSVNTLPTDFDDSLVLDGNSPISKLKLYSAYKKFESFLDEGESYIEESKKNYSLRELLDIIYKQKNLTELEKKLFILFEKGIENENAAELDKASAIGYYKESDKITGQDQLVVDGYDSILKRLLGDIKVHYNQIVRKVDYQNSVSKIYTDTKTFESEFVIITLPVGVLQRNKIQFNPPLPKEKVEAISKIPFGVFNKLILEFESAFWKSKQTLFYQLNNIKSQQQDLILNLEPYLNKPILAFLYSGENAKNFEKDDQALSKAKKELFAIFGSSIPDPIRVIKTNWFADPFSHGSYTFAARNMKYLTMEYSKPIKNLFFAGEGTHKEYSSYVHGAYLSGLREAERINNII